MPWAYPEIKRTKWALASYPGLAWFPVPQGEGKKRAPGVHCSRMCQVSMVTCILLRYTKITTNFSLPAERPHCQGYVPCEDHLERFEVRNYITLTVMVCIALFETSVNFKANVVAFSWSGQMCGSFLQPKS